MHHQLARITPPASDDDLRALAELLVAVVQNGDVVSFVEPLTVDDAETWWRETLDSAGPNAVFLVAWEGPRIVGSGQLHPSWAPNQPHRAEIAKLMVHPDARGRGLGRRLMEELERAAQEGGYALLTLDTKRGVAAEALYHSLGWTEVGVVPRFAVDPDGVTPHDAVIFYKELRPPPAGPQR